MKHWIFLFSISLIGYFDTVGKRLTCNVQAVAQLELPGFMEPIIRNKQPAGRIYYVDSLLLPYSDVIKRVRKEGTLLSLEHLLAGTNSITLSKAERKYLLAELSGMKKLAWPDGLLENSEKISSDSAFTYLRGIEISSVPFTNSGIKFWQFSRPVYLRDSTICFIGFAFRCERLCGELEWSFYKKNPLGKWEKYVAVLMADF